ncbi:unnamed protein product [Jaminaea pallidilutea]
MKFPPVRPKSVPRANSAYHSSIDDDHHFVYPRCHLVVARHSHCQLLTSMRPTISLFSKALRHPLSSKRGNKDYYKGTRTGNVLLKKRMPYLSHGGTRIQLDAKGRERTWTMPKDRVDGSGRLDESKMTSFVVPPGLEGTQLKPYVHRNEHTQGTPTPVSGYATFEDEERGVVLPPGGLEGRSYEALRRLIWSRRAV